MSCYQAPGLSGLDLAFGVPGDGMKVHRASVVGDKEQFYSLLAIYRLQIKGGGKVITVRPDMVYNAVFVR